MQEKKKETFANTDFADRNLVLKKEDLAIIATEQSLDDWHAQSLNMAPEQFSKARKDYKRMTRSRVKSAQQRPKIGSVGNAEDRSSISSKKKLAGQEAAESNVNIDFNQKIDQYRTMNKRNMI